MPVPPKKPAASAPKKPGKRKPGVEVGDSVYFKHGEQHTHGRVVSHGAHGCHIDHDGGRAKVYWEDILGHRSRSAKSAEIVDRGDDGFLLRDDKGRQRFVAGEAPEPKRDDTPDDHRDLIETIHRNTPMTKSILPPDARVMFFKGGPLANRPGLTQKKLTDKTGHQTTRWVRNGPKEPANDNGGGKPTPEAGAHAGYGTHDIQPGSRVKFKAGEHAGEGEVTAVGEHGVTAKDSTGREHQIHHHEITHFQPAEGGAADGAAKKDGPLFDEATVKALPAKKNQPCNNQKELYAKSDEALGQLKEWLDPLCKGMGMKTDASMDSVDWDGEGHYLFIAPLKGVKRATEKVEADYGGDWSQLRDVVRCSIAVDKPEQLHDVLAKLNANGLKLAMKPKDRFAKPTPVGYRDVLMNIELPNGTIGEMQLHVKGMLKAKEEGHKPYETMRSLFAKYGEDSDMTEWHDDDQNAFFDAIDESKKIYNGAWAKISGEGGDEKTEKDAPDLHKSMPSSNMQVRVLLFRKVEK